METETKPRSTKRTGRIRRAQALALPLAGLLAFATVALARAQEPRVDLVLDPDGRVGTEELLRLTVTVSSPRGDIGRPGFELDNLRIVSGPSQSTSVQFLNGVSSQSISFSWIVQPEKLGPGRVRSGAIRVGERTISLPERQVEVVENPPARNPMRRQAARDPFSSRDPFESFFDPLGRRGRRPPPPSRPPEIFLEAEISPRRPYVGQQVLYTLFLYTDVTVRSVTPSELPDFKGFWTQVIPQPNNPDLEWVVRDNREIGRIVLLQRALFPRRAGELEIGPVKATMNAMVRDTRPLGSIFPEPHDVQRSTKATTIEVRQLPEPSPDDFRGAVGRMEVAASLEPRELEMGEAATLTLELKGEGHLQGLP
ncbi:MAG: BatD family protein, partial [Holophagales bacterium]|nr:BatD family protein [Holophagales bacterium]